MKNLKGLLAFLLLAIAPLLFWITETGLKLLQSGWGWAPVIQAPIFAAILAFVLGGRPSGVKYIAGNDEAGPFFNRFWGIFIVAVTALLIFGFVIKSEA